MYQVYVRLRRRRGSVGGGAHVAPCYFWTDFMLVTDELTRHAQLRTCPILLNRSRIESLSCDFKKQLKGSDSQEKSENIHQRMAVQTEKGAWSVSCAPIWLDICGNVATPFLFVTGSRMSCVRAVSYTHLTLPTICSV